LTKQCFHKFIIELLALKRFFVTQVQTAHWSYAATHWPTAATVRILDRNEVVYTGLAHRHRAIVKAAPFAVAANLPLASARCTHRCLVTRRCCSTHQRGQLTSRPVGRARPAARALRTATLPRCLPSGRCLRWPDSYRRREYSARIVKFGAITHYVILNLRRHGHLTISQRRCYFSEAMRFPLSGFRTTYFAKVATFPPTYRRAFS